jgi:hypothetical protein
MGIIRGHSITLLYLVLFPRGQSSNLIDYILLIESTQLLLLSTS